MDQLKEKSRKAFDAQAADYDRTEKGAHARRLYPHVLAALDGVREGELLDVGCGTGALARLVLEQGPKRRVTGVDLAPGMVAHARASLAAFGDRARIAEADSERLPFHEESFDAAYCNDSFHHYPDPGKAVFEIWRGPARGGRLHPARAGAGRHERIAALLVRGRRAHLLEGRVRAHPRAVVLLRGVAARRRLGVSRGGAQVEPLLRRPRHSTPRSSAQGVMGHGGAFRWHGAGTAGTLWGMAKAPGRRSSARPRKNSTSASTTSAKKNVCRTMCAAHSPVEMRLLPRHSAGFRPPNSTRNR